MVHKYDQVSVRVVYNTAFISQMEEKAQEEKRRFENEYERARTEAMERMKQDEERRKQEEKERVEILQQQMEELRLRELEVRTGAPLQASESPIHQLLFGIC